MEYGDKGVKQGSTTVACPVPGCKTKHRFQETLQTLDEAALTKSRRENYLRLQHRSGAHGKGSK
jgi:hypothetical protein